jgi:hypothetical protein
MTSTVAVTNGVGVQTGKLFAFDAVSTVNLTGLASAYNGLALTAYVTTRDGRIALAPLATATAGTTTASFAFDFRTAPCRGLFSTGAETNQEVRLRVIVTATSQVVCDALLDMVPGAEAGTTTTSTGSAGATLAEAQALVDAHIADATAAHAASAVSVAATPENYTAATADVEAHLAGIDDALASAIGDVVGPPGATDGRPALFDGATGKLLKQHTAALGGAAVLNVGTTAGTVAAGDDSRLSNSRTPLAHAASHATGQADALAAADIGAEPVQTAASQAEMEDGAEEEIRSVSPLRVAQAIAALGGGGAVLQVVSAADSTSYSIYNAVIPVDGTIPQISEGQDYPELAVTITPRAAKSKILLKYSINVGAQTSSNNQVVFAVFRDTDAAALFATQHLVMANKQAQIAWEIALAAGSTAPRTYHLRTGQHVVMKDHYLNRIVGTDNHFGGVEGCSVVAMEVAV